MRIENSLPTKGSVIDQINALPSGTVFSTNTGSVYMKCVGKEAMVLLNDMPYHKAGSYFSTVFTPAFSSITIHPNATLKLN